MGKRTTDGETWVGERTSLKLSCHVVQHPPHLRIPGCFFLIHSKALRIKRSTGDRTLMHATHLYSGRDKDRCLVDFFAGRVFYMAQVTYVMNYVN